MEYGQSSGKLLDREGNLVAIGYSGAAGIGKNNPTMQGVQDEGPIPVGHYTIKGPPFDSAKHGPYCLYLVPDEATRTSITLLGRDPNSFLIHGDKIGAPGTASEGCIILSRSAREAVWNNNFNDPDLYVNSGLIQDLPDLDGEIAT